MVCPNVCGTVSKLTKAYSLRRTNSMSGGDVCIYTIDKQQEHYCELESIAGPRTMARYALSQL